MSYSLYDEYMGYIPNIYYCLKKVLNEDYIAGFLFGSLAKKCISRNSDIDILVIGKKDKNIDLLCLLDYEIEKLGLSCEVDLKYYNINVFRKLRNEGCLFLSELSNHCINLEVICNEKKLL